MVWYSYMQLVWISMEQKWIHRGEYSSSNCVFVTTLTDSLLAQAAYLILSSHIL
jgi:hypothetical protein